MNLPILIIDAFTADPFKGNQAAVVILNEEKSSEWMQKVAAEMNLSETAFLLKSVDGFNLRWFTPTVEVPLCGHATLASAHALWSEGVLDRDSSIRFHTCSGLLTAESRGSRIEMNFPSMRMEETELPQQAREALNVNPKRILASVGRGPKDVYYLLELETSDDVLAVKPDFALLKGTGACVIVTAPSSDSTSDFVSRFFAPAHGVNEDPVTGSAHCALMPYWGAKLGKSELIGYQASARGGVVFCGLQGDRVLLAGDAVTVLRGELLALTEANSFVSSGD